MIHGIGIDIVENKRIKASIDKFGDQFLEKIYTKEEIEYCASKKNSIPHFSARFAAKEAVLKAFGTGLRSGFSWTDIEIFNDSLGKPCLKESEKIKKFFSCHKISHCFISLSHSDDYSVANVICDSK